MRIRQVLPALVLAQCFASAAFAQTTGPKPAPSTTKFPTFGLSLIPPDGATATIPASVGHVSEYRFGSDSPYANCAIFVEVVPLRSGQTLDDLAQNISKKAGAAIDPAPAQIAGEKAVKLTAPFKRDKVTHRTTYMVAHEDRAYLLSALDTDEATVNKPLANLISSAAFIPLESPSQHLGDFYDKSFRVFNVMSMNGPASLRAYEQNADYVELCIHDFVLHTQTMYIEINRIQLPQPKAFAEVRDAFSATLKEKLSLAEPFQWKQHAKCPQLNCSQPVFQQIKLPNGQIVKMIGLYNVLDCGNGTWIQILFNIPDRPELDPKPYIALTQRMLDTLSLTTSPSTATRP